jgi:hypothetical protein
MKPLRFVLAPKNFLFTVVAILLLQLHAKAQNPTFAYFAPKAGSEAPAKALNIQIKQLQQGQLLFQLLVENPNNEKLTLYIKDNFNNTLHKESIPLTAKFEGRYNLQSLEDGSYTFEIRNGRNTISEKAVNIKTQTLRNVLVTE